VSEVRGRRAKATDATVEAQGAVLEEQRRMLAELQTPVIQVWEGVLALPIVGSLDTARAQEMTEALLERIVESLSDPGDIVLDPYAGSGTTLAVAARNCGLAFMMFLC